METSLIYYNNVAPLISASQPMAI